MDDCQKFLRYVLRCSVVCEVGKNIAETFGYAVSFSLQIRTMVISYFLVLTLQALAYRQAYNDGQRQQFVVVDYSQQCHEQCLEWRQAEAAQQHVLEPEWEKRYKRHNVL